MIRYKNIYKNTHIVSCYLFNCLLSDMFQNLKLVAHNHKAIQIEGFTSTYVYIKLEVSYTGVPLDSEYK